MGLDPESFRYLREVGVIKIKVTAQDGSRWMDGADMVFAGGGVLRWEAGEGQWFDEDGIDR